MTRAGWPVLVPPARLRAAYALDSVIGDAATNTDTLSTNLGLTCEPKATFIAIADLS